MYKNYEPEIKINEFVAQKMLADIVSNIQNSPSHFSNYKSFIETIHDQISLEKPYFQASWSLGGTWCDYTGRTGRVSPETPVELVVLDDFLMKHYPQTSFMQYKTISNNIQNISTSEGDYYGGSVDIAIKRITYEDLSDVLVQVGLEKPGQVLNRKQFEDFVTENYSTEWFEESFPKSAKKKNSFK